MVKLRLGSILGLVVLLSFVPHSYGDPVLVQLDFVNIGDPTSEAGHQITGWGPVEPKTNGGSWGDIANEKSPDGNVDDTARVAWSASEDADDPISRSAFATFQIGEGQARRLRLRILDGFADDSFMVYVKGRGGDWVPVYIFRSEPKRLEVWRTHDVDLYQFRNYVPLTGYPLVVRVQATGAAWSMKPILGQLAVNWIQVVGVAP